MLRLYIFRLSFLFLMLGYFSCKKSGGEDGLSSLIDITAEASGANCANGGLKISSGIDKNRNGVLDASERQNQYYVCNGANGQNGASSLFDVAVEASGPNCTNGGYKLMSGLDANRNDLLDPVEIQNTIFICNGVNMLVNSNYESPGINCENGGYRLESGYDLDGNGLLDPIEITNTQYACNGNNGIADRLTRIDIPHSFANTTSTSLIIGDLLKFNKRDYQTDSIAFVAAPYTGGTGNTATVELYDITNNQPIPNSALSSSLTYSSSSYQFSPNIYNFLPDQEITLGIRLTNDVNGQFAGSGNSDAMLFIYKK